MPQYLLAKYLENIGINLTGLTKKKLETDVWRWWLKESSMQVHGIRVWCLARASLTWIFYLFRKCTVSKYRLLKWLLLSLFFWLLDIGICVVSTLELVSCSDSFSGVLTNLIVFLPAWTLTTLSLLLEVRKSSIFNTRPLLMFSRVESVSSRSSTIYLSDSQLQQTWCQILLRCSLRSFQIYGTE